MRMSVWCSYVCSSDLSGRSSHRGPVDRLQCDLAEGHSEPSPCLGRLTGRGVRIGVIDDSVDYLHPDLAANYDQTADWDAIRRDDDAYPEWSFLRPNKK